MEHGCNVGSVLLFLREIRCSAGVQVLRFCSFGEVVFVGIQSKLPLCKHICCVGFASARAGIWGRSRFLRSPLVYSRACASDHWCLRAHMLEASWILRSWRLQSGHHVSIIEAKKNEHSLYLPTCCDEVPPQLHIMSQWDPHWDLELLAQCSVRPIQPNMQTSQQSVWCLRIKEPAHITT